MVGLRPIDVRRAVLSVFFSAGGGPLPIAEVVRRTRDHAGLDLALLRGVPPERRVSDILRHQVRAGRAVAVERGCYRVDVTAFSASTVRRCHQWRAEANRRRMRAGFAPLP